MMRRIGMIAVAACALASCGKSPQSDHETNAMAPIVENGVEEGNAANNVTNIAQPAKGGADDEAMIRDIIDGVYAAYSTPSGPTTKPVVSPDFKAALDTAEASDEAGLGYDPWCECQDFDEARFSHVVKSVQFAPDGDHARASVSLDLGFSGTGRVAKWIGLVRTSKGWLVDDLSDAKGKSLKAAIRAAPTVELSEGNVAG